LPSSQVVSLIRAGLLQTPVTLLQVPTSWHWSEAAGHMTAVPLPQTKSTVGALPNKIRLEKEVVTGRVVAGSVVAGVVVTGVHDWMVSPAQESQRRM
jgi:hypothetical protein